MTADRMLDVEVTAKRRGTTKELVAIEPGTCPACGSSLEHESTGQLPLIRHGGYGAVQQRTMAYCVCGWSLLRAVSEVNPRVR